MERWNPGRVPKRALVAMLLVVGTAVVGACDRDDQLLLVDLCDARALPFSSGGDAPVVTGVTIEAQPTGLVVLLTATDPQGSADLADVVQEISLHGDVGCTTVAATARDDLACSGCEESFGTVVDANAALYPKVAAAARWPVSVRIRDAGGHLTEGTVEAPVVPPS